MVHLLWRYLRASHLLRQHDHATERWLARFASVDPRTLPDFELWSVVDAWTNDAPNYMKTVRLFDNVTFRETSVRKAWRERVRSDLVRVLGAVRRWHLALADRFVERGWLDTRDDYFLLHLGEIAAIVNGQRPSNTLREIVAARQRESFDERKRAGLALT
jgi:hypothetical protein